MPINDKQREFIAQYLTNGHNASDAYRVAYPKVKSGWNAHGARLIAKDSVKQEIERKRALMEVRSERTVQSIDSMYQTAYDLAQETKQSSSMVSACTGLARLYGMDKDNQLQTDTPTALTPEQVEEATRAANLVLSNSMKDTA